MIGDALTTKTKQRLQYLNPTKMFVFDTRIKHRFDTNLVFRYRLKRLLKIIFTFLN